MMMKSVVLLAVALGCVVPQVAFAERELQFDWGKAQGSSGKSSSSIQCGSSSKAKEIKFEVNKLVKALDGAVAIACKGGSPYDVAKDYESGVAVAFAAALSASYSGCRSSGNAFGCASAKAKTEAYAKSVGAAFAKGYAVAIRKCGWCYKNKKFDVDSDGILAFLFARAEALAKTSACAAGNSAASAEAYAACFAAALSKVVAKVIAVAIAPKWCTYKKLVANAKAVTEAKFLTVTGCAAKTKTYAGGEKAKSDAYVDGDSFSKGFSFGGF